MPFSGEVVGLLGQRLGLLVGEAGRDLAPTSASTTIGSSPAAGARDDLVDDLVGGDAVARPRPGTTAKPKPECWMSGSMGLVRSEPSSSCRAWPTGFWRDGDHHRGDLVLEEPLGPRRSGPGRCRGRRRRSPPGRPRPPRSPTVVSSVRSPELDLDRRLAVVASARSATRASRSASPKPPMARPSSTTLRGTLSPWTRPSTTQGRTAAATITSGITIATAVAEGERGAFRPTLWRARPPDPTGHPRVIRPSPPDVRRHDSIWPFRRTGMVR